MKNKAILISLLLIFLSVRTINAQGTVNELKLSLKEAQDYAISNNKMMITSRMDVDASKAAVWEIISNALPQVTASGSFTDNLKLMTTLLPGEFLGQPAGTKVPITFGTQYNSSGSVQASLLIFNAPLYIGIETTKLANKLK